MKIIRLGNDGETVVDNSEYGHLKKFHWYEDANGYVVRHDRCRGTKVFYMHRQILGFPEKLVIDHIDGDKRNNCLVNLRICHQKNNAQNRKGWGKKRCPYKGVFFDTRKRTKKWIASITVDRKQIYLGYHPTAEEAAAAYNTAAVKYHGEFALLNTIP